jgi:hypothetical protein
MVTNVAQIKHFECRFADSVLSHIDLQAFVLCLNVAETGLAFTPDCKQASGN